MDPETVTVDLPRHFYEDHVSRELPGGTVVKELKHKVRVELTQDEYEEMLSDARHYAHPDGPRDFDGWRGLWNSAKAAVRRLEAVETPWRRTTGMDQLRGLL